ALWVGGGGPPSAHTVPAIMGARPAEVRDTRKKTRAAEGRFAELTRKGRPLARPAVGASAGSAGLRRPWPWLLKEFWLLS
ncbi:MAG: hypothetical protein ACLGIS_13800, partial [Actinomycetes bacterium]